jgi:glycosyltransferase involved in cell wall biosynthesis
MKISVLVTTYKRSEYLKEALCSVQLQTHTDWEILIFDDAACVDTFEVYKSFKLRNPLKRILYITTFDRKDLYRQSWLMASDLANGDIIVKLDDDDLLAHGSLEFISRLYDENPELDFSFGSSINFHENGEFGEVTNTYTPLEIEKTRSAWLPYTIPNNNPWKDPWTFVMDYYDEPQHWTSIIHCSKSNIFCAYHLYAMRTHSVRRVKDKIKLHSNFASDLEFLGSLEYMGLGYNSIKKILYYVRTHAIGRITDSGLTENGVTMFDDIMKVRDDVDELRPSGFLPKIINLRYDSDINSSGEVSAMVRDESKRFYEEIKSLVNSI